MSPSRRAAFKAKEDAGSVSSAQDENQVASKEASGSGLKNKPKSVVQRASSPTSIVEATPEVGGSASVLPSEDEKEVVEDALGEIEVDNDEDAASWK